MSSVVLNSNVASLQAQRRLSEGTSTLTKSLERLSSGLRINRAGDDAAGLSISESLKADRRTFNQGVRNLNDGLSLLSIADSTIESLSSVVIRLKELSEQAANGVYGSKQRQAIDAEAQALAKEYSRVSQSAKYNSIGLLDGSFGRVTFQGGYGVNGGITSSMGGAMGDGTFAAAQNFGFVVSDVIDINADGLSDVISTASAVSVLVSNGDGTFQLKSSNLSGVSVSDARGGDFDGDGIIDLAVANSGTGTVSVFRGNGDGTFRAANTVVLTDVNNINVLTVGDFNGDGRDDIAATDGGLGRFYVALSQGNGSFSAAVSRSYTGLAVKLTNGDVNGDGQDDILISSFTSTQALVYVSNGDGSFRTAASLPGSAFVTDATFGDLNGDGMLDALVTDGNADSTLVFVGNGDGTFKYLSEYSSGDGTQSVTIGDFNGDGINDFYTGNENDSVGSLFLGNGDGTFQQRLTSTFQIHINYQVFSGDFNGDGVLDIAGGASGADLRLANTRDGVSSLRQFSLKTVAGAKEALSLFTLKLQQLSTQRGKVGALQSRIGVAVNALQINSENSAAAVSRITDVDVAEEASLRVRASIIQNASASILAQANAQPALALKLLGKG